MGRAEWGADPEFFGPRHAFRESLILSELGMAQTGGLHLECAAGVGSLALKLARGGSTVVSADLSLRSLAVLRRRAGGTGLEDRILPVVADITQLPFPDGVFPTATTAETLEHVPNHAAAVRELGRVLQPGGLLVGTVPAGPGQWSDWDDWAGHLRRYTTKEMQVLLEAGGLEPRVRTWGFPLVRLYDGLFLKRVNRRRLQSAAPVDRDPTLSKVQRLARSGWLVQLVRAVFSVDRLFNGTPWGVGLLFAAHKPKK